MSADYDILTEMIATIYNVEPETIKAWIQQRKAKDAARVAHNNERYDEALLRTTEVQATKVDMLKRAGAHLHNRIRVNRRSGNIVLFLDKRMWNSQKQRIGRKFYAVYPDGTHAETYERSISVRTNF